MDLGRIIKWLLILGVVMFAWKVGVPWIQKQSLTPASASGGAGDSPCVRAAEAASESWGSGLARFAGPNPDSTQWSVFRGMVDGRISSAESACSCAAQSCGKARQALSELRGLVSEMDGALRSSSSPPADAVQRQEAIDNQLDEARNLARSGN